MGELFEFYVAVTLVTFFLALPTGLYIWSFGDSHSVRVGRRWLRVALAAPLWPLVGLALVFKAGQIAWGSDD